MRVRVKQSTKNMVAVRWKAVKGRLVFDTSRHIDVFMRTTATAGPLEVPDSYTIVNSGQYTSMSVLYIQPNTSMTT